MSEQGFEALLEKMEYQNLIEQVNLDYTSSGQPIILEPGYAPETIKYRVLSKFDGWVYMTYEREWNIAAKRLLRAKEAYVSRNLDKIPFVLAHPDKAIIDPEYPESTHIYYKIVTLHDGSQSGLAVPICIKEPKYIYTAHSWKGDRVKGETRGLKITWLLR
jgi:hypothetical protein